MAENGDCFEVTGKVAIEAYVRKDADPSMRVVHGLPVGRGRVNGSKLFWHGWIEVGDVVIDRSNGLDVTMPRDEYYRLGQIEEDRVWRFTVDEAADEMREREHYGPWVNGWEDMDDPAC